MGGHTIIPWRVGYTGRCIVRSDQAGDDGYMVAALTAHGLLPVEEAKANAAFIVEAVNSYEQSRQTIEALVGALERIARGGSAVLLDAALSDAPEGFEECPVDPKVLQQIVDDARSALLLAGEKNNG